MTRIMIWISGIAAVAFAVMAADCAWMCTPGMRNMAMRCFFSRITGLSCDIDMLAVLVAIAVTAVLPPLLWSVLRTDR